MRAAPFDGQGSVVGFASVEPTIAVKAPAENVAPSSFDESVPFSWKVGIDGLSQRSSANVTPYFSEPNVGVAE